MFEQDYLMKQIKQSIQALERVLFKKKEGKQEEALSLINHSLAELLEIDEKNFQDISLDETISVLENYGAFNAELAVIIADLIYEKCDLMDNRNDINKCYLQALLLYMKAIKYRDIAFPLQSLDKISQIKKNIRKSDLEKVKKLVD